MTKLTIRFFLAMVACGIAGVSPSPAADPAPAAAPSSARTVMDKAIHDVLAILRDDKLSADQKREKVRQIGYDNMSFEVMSRLSLGKFWRDLTDAQRTQFQQEFKQFVTNSYGSLTDSYHDQDVKILGDRKEDDGDWTVQTRITTANNDKSTRDTSVDYRLRQIDNQWKVIDFTVDGVSMVINFRSQFQETMSNGGIDRLLKLLHEKNAGHEKQ